MKVIDKVKGCKEQNITPTHNTEKNINQFLKQQHMLFLTSFPQKFLLKPVQMIYIYQTHCIVVLVLAHCIYTQHVSQC